MSIAAFNFTSRLPVDLRGYAMGIDPSGDITLDWYFSKRWNANLSISPTGEIDYATVANGAIDIHSGEFDDDAFMEKLFANIRRVINLDD